MTLVPEGEEDGSTPGIAGVGVPAAAVLVRLVAALGRDLGRARRQVVRAAGRLRTAVAAARITVAMREGAVAAPRVVEGAVGGRFARPTAAYHLRLDDLDQVTDYGLRLVFVLIPKT